MKLHTTALNGGTRHARVLNLLALAFLACFAASFSTNAAPPPMLSSNRFLFIFDASASMKPFDAGLRETVFDLIYSGVRGRMTNGDTYGIWVIQDRNDISFPMDVWRGRHAVEMGAKATAHIKDHGFKGSARLDLAIADALRVVRNVGDLTIVLVSNGETPIAGTPFDDAINARYRELAPQMKRAKSTLNTVFVSQDGALVAWAANAPEFLIEVPYVVPKPKPAKIDIAAIKTNTLSASNLPVTTVAVPFPPANPAPAAKPRVATTPIIITRETVAQERRAWAAMTSTATNETLANETNTGVAPLSPTNAIASSTNSVANAVAGVATAAVTNSSTNAVAPKPPVIATTVLTPKPIEAASSNLAVFPATPRKPKPAESVSALAPGNAPAVSSVSARDEQTRSTSQPLLWASLGGAAAVACVLIGVFVARSQRRDASLISRAIAQQHSPSS